MKTYSKPIILVENFILKDVLLASSVGNQIEAVDITFDWEGENERW